MARLSASGRPRRRLPRQRAGRQPSLVQQGAAQPARPAALEQIFLSNVTSIVVGICPSMPPVSSPRALGLCGCGVAGLVMLGNAMVWGDESVLTTGDKRTQPSHVTECSLLPYTWSSQTPVEVLHNESPRTAFGPCQASSRYARRRQSHFQREALLCGLA